MRGSGRVTPSPHPRARRSTSAVDSSASRSDRAVAMRRETAPATAPAVRAPPISSSHRARERRPPAAGEASEVMGEVMPPSVGGACPPGERVGVHQRKEINASCSRATANRRGARGVLLSVKIPSACAWPLVGAALAAAAAGVGSAPAGASPPRTITRSTTVSYAGCPAGAVTLSLRVPRNPVPAGTPVRVAVTLHNASPRACGPNGSTVTITGAPSLRSALLNPCGALHLAIDDERNVQVYPPFEAIACPVLVAPKLEGGSSVTALETWNQIIGGAGRPARRPQPAPRGAYHVVVGTALRAPIVLVPARSS